MNKEIQRIEKQLHKIEKELEKVRMSNVFDDGWQTQRYAKKQRKYDFLSLEKFELLKKLDELKNGEKETK
jgi:hypothetical protein